MAAYFLDSSALVKRYTQEPGSPWVHAITDPPSGSAIFACRITRVEVTAALARQFKAGNISRAELAAALADLQNDFTTGFRCVPVTPGLLALASDLALEYALRGYDAVQLAALLHVNTQLQVFRASPATLVSADSELNEAAVQEGLAVEDPNEHE